MRHIEIWIPILLLWVALACEAFSARPIAEELARMCRWVAASALRARSKSTPPFSFIYGGQSSSILFGTWRVKRQRQRLDANRTRHTLTYADPQTGLLVRCVAVEYRDFPTLEWTLYFKNGGSADTPILQEIRALDTRFERGSQAEFVLHHQTGGLATPGDYQPFETTLGPKAEKAIATSGGRPTNSNLPYFNIEWPGGGVIVAVGWPGQWAAQFSRDERDGLTVRAGQELTHFRLHPGEEVRSPLIVLQFYSGDWIRGQNIWRRWMVAHNLPRPGGALPAPLWTPCSSHQYGEMIGANEENQKMFIDRYIEEGMKPDYWWMDAGWYFNDGTWVNTGTWEVDTKRFPRGLRAISDHAHAKGVRTLAWFEPERVTAGTWLYEHHPEWLLAPAGLPEDLAYQAQWRLLDLGNPEARRWLTEHVDRLLVEQGIDLYRQDFNMDPLCFWRANDAADRQGITEIRYVEGYLAYWDELRRRHPDMLIDSCASGGRRNDLETLRRAVPFIRSDYLFEPTGQQCHMYGISFWVPYNGTGAVDRRSLMESKIVSPFWLPKDRWCEIESDAYLFRSVMSPHLTPAFDVRDKDLDYASFRRLMSQWRHVAPGYYGDYYPLTPYSLKNNVWMAWQFDRPEAGEGLVQAFRRAECAEAFTRFRLRGLEADARYVVTDLDEGRPQQLTGRLLLERGLPVHIADQPGATVIWYHRTR
jgi:alpha-galactosidase